MNTKDWNKWSSSKMTIKVNFSKFNEPKPEQDTILQSADNTTCLENNQHILSSILTNQDIARYGFWYLATNIPTLTCDVCKQFIFAEKTIESIVLEVSKIEQRRKRKGELIVALGSTSEINEKKIETEYC